MKTLYFDCFAGASGDMILGSLVAAGVEPRALIDQLQLLGVAGWKIDFETVDRSGISATHARVQTAHEHAHRHLNDILKIIYQSQLKQSIKDRAGLIFSRLAEAEARVHNQPVEKIHFHEVGAIDRSTISNYTDTVVYPEATQTKRRYDQLGATKAARFGARGHG